MTNQLGTRVDTYSTHMLSVFRIVVGLLVVAFFTFGFNLLHQHASFLTKGDTVDMDAILEEGGEYPVGEFVHAEAMFILDAFASEESKTNGITSKKDVYYYVILNNRDAVAVKVGSKDLIAIMDKGTQDTFDYLDEKIDYFDDIPVEGKLKRLTDAELIGYFDEASDEYGFNGENSKITPRYYVIDATELRMEKVLLYIVLPLAVIIGVAVIAAAVSRKRKKAKQQ